MTDRAGTGQEGRERRRLSCIRPWTLFQIQEQEPRNRWRRPPTLVRWYVWYYVVGGGALVTTLG